MAADDTDYGSNFDLGSFEDMASADALNNIDLSSLGGGNQDFGSNFDLGSFEDQLASLNQQDFGSNFDLGAFQDLMSNPEFASAINLGEGLDMGGLGLTGTGRGQLSQFNPDTGATGLTAEGFRNLQDLLGSGTAEEIARYTPGTADYALRSGIETPGGLGLSADATRGVGIKEMGGAQGLTDYIPAEYGGSVLADLAKRNPGEFSAIEDYLSGDIYGGQGITPFKGTGGTLTEKGFLQQSSAANPLGATYALGDPKSFINNPKVSGNQAVVSPGGLTLGQLGGGQGGGQGGGLKGITDKIAGALGAGGAGGATQQQQKKSGLSDLLPLLLLMLAMNRGGGGGGGSTATIPGLTATQKQTPYADQQKAPGYRPGQGGVTYFEPTQYTPKAAAGGGISRLLKGRGDGVSDSIPAVIEGNMADGGQPAKLARGEYVIDARTVAALGNGSTDAGADRLDQMRKKILSTDRKAGVGKDSKAYRHLLS